jgi:hypothetical protein
LPKIFPSRKFIFKTEKLGQVVSSALKHHAALVNSAGECADRHNQSKKWVDAKYTSATEGSRRGNSWSKDGLRKFNSLSIMVKDQRTNDDTGTAVDEDLRA